MKWDIVLKRKFIKIVAVLLALLVLPGVSLYSAVDFSGLFTFETKAVGNESTCPNRTIIILRSQNDNSKYRTHFLSAL